MSEPIQIVLEGLSAGGGKKADLILSTDEKGIWMRLVLLKERASIKGEIDAEQAVELAAYLVEFAKFVTPKEGHEALEKTFQDLRATIVPPNDR